jgi:hypothetical protein
MASKTWYLRALPSSSCGTISISEVLVTHDLTKTLRGQQLVDLLCLQLTVFNHQETARFQ